VKDSFEIRKRLSGYKSTQELGILLKQKFKLKDIPVGVEFDSLGCVDVRRNRGARACR